MEVEGKRMKNETELCVPCLTDGVKTEPDGFCKDCEEFMCQQCFEYHLRVKSCRNHVLSNTDDGHTPAQQLTQGEICRKHTNETVKFYCRKHDLVGCGDCMIPDHGTCKPEVIREIVTHFEQSLEFKGMLRQVDQCDIDLTESESHIEQNRRENKNMISDALNEIRKFRTDINNYYDRVETEIVTEANNVAKENEELMSQLEVKILSFRQEIAEIKETLDTSRITAENMFIRVIENKRKFYQIEKLVAELKMKNNLKVFKFEPEQRVKEIQSSGVKLGNLTMSIHKYQPSANSGDSKNSSKLRNNYK